MLESCELHRMLELELLDWGQEAVSFRCKPGAWARDTQSGFVHGGILATALDTAACFAVIAVVGADCSTIDLRCDYLRPALDDEYVVRGTPLRLGKRFAWADAAILTATERLIATARGTFVW